MLGGFLSPVERRLNLSCSSWRVRHHVHTNFMSLGGQMRYVRIEKSNQLLLCDCSQVSHFNFCAIKVILKKIKMEYLFYNFKFISAMHNNFCSPFLFFLFNSYHRSIGVPMDMSVNKHDEDYKKAYPRPCINRRNMNDMIPNNAGIVCMLILWPCRLHPFYLDALYKLSFMLL